MWDRAAYLALELRGASSFMKVQATFTCMLELKRQPDLFRSAALCLNRYGTVKQPHE
jgi:hypothetical protein